MTDSAAHQPASSADLVAPSEPITEDPRPAKMLVAKSLVLVNTGDGKGKTSAAMGVIVRAVARDWPVATIQFLKSGSWKAGEEKICQQLGVDWWAIGEGFSWESEDLDTDKATAAMAWAHAKEIITGAKYRLVVMDEITYPINWGWIDIDDVVATIANRPEAVSVIVTGRDAPQAIIDVADTVTEMRSIKHAYERGIVAKKGIDF
jgi:cob(I)alamin adenosyltransferase